MSVSSKVPRTRPEAFLFERSIDIETDDRHAEKLREELTFDLWVHSSLEQRQRFQQLFFPDGIAASVETIRCISVA